MHPNPIYRTDAENRILDFTRHRGFGTLIVIVNADTVLAAHVPFRLSPDGRRAEAHLVRSNPILKHLPAAALLIVSGPDGYISPDWYGVEDQVPTWNYVAAHLRGSLRVIEGRSTEAHLAYLSEIFEARLDKAPWTMDKMTEQTKQRMMRAIQPVELEIESLDSTWKLNQNKPDAVRLSAAEHVSDGIGYELQELSQLMRKPPR